MDKKVKEEIEETVEDMSQDEEVIGMYYSKKRHEQVMDNTRVSDAKRENSIEIAKKLLSMNMNVQDISKATDLSTEEINNLYLK